MSVRSVEGAFANPGVAPVSLVFSTGLTQHRPGNCSNVPYWVSSISLYRRDCSGLNTAWCGADHSKEQLCRSGFLAFASIWNDDLASTMEASTSTNSNPSVNALANFVSSNAYVVSSLGTRSSSHCVLDCIATRGLVGERRVWPSLPYVLMHDEIAHAGANGARRVLKVL